GPRLPAEYEPPDPAAAEPAPRGAAPLRRPRRRLQRPHSSRSSARPGALHRRLRGHRVHRLPPPRHRLQPVAPPNPRSPVPGLKSSSPVSQSSTQVFGLRSLGASNIQPRTSNIALGAGAGPPSAQRPSPITNHRPPTQAQTP